MNPLLVTSGEPAGIGPDICLALAAHNYPVVIVADKAILAARAKKLGLSIKLDDYQQGVPPVSAPNHLTVLSLPCSVPVTPGKLNPLNAPYVIQMLTLAAERCLSGEFSAIITAPVHKAVINQFGLPFTGHTEFFAQKCHAESIVMMLMCATMKVALVTTHLPLNEIASAITIPSIMNVITILDTCLKRDFSISNPKIYVAGLNPHAGEGGYLGHEEIDTIIPALSALQKKGINVHGPFPADTMFSPHNLDDADVFVAMYHDQGLPVLKYAGFGHAVNITLGLPIIRTSVDHGTALELAGTGLAESSSLLAAVDAANNLARLRK